MTALKLNIGIVCAIARVGRFALGRKDALNFEAIMAPLKS